MRKDGLARSHKVPRTVLPHEKTCPLKNLGLIINFFILGTRDSVSPGYCTLTIIALSSVVRSS